MKTGTLVQLAATGLLSLALTGCSIGAELVGAPGPTSSVDAGTAGGQAATGTQEGDAAPGESEVAGSADAPGDQDGSSSTGASGQGAELQSDERYRPTAWDPEAYPEYVRVDGTAIVTDAPAAGEVVYGGLDSLGRTQRVVATVDHDMYERSRGSNPHFDKDDNPSGWGHNAEVVIEVPNGKAYHGYFWNRSHLLADSLGGEAERENLICGTRTQNVGANDGQGGMAYEETRVREWLRDHPSGTVYYSVTPVYEGDELVPRSVFVDVRTSDGGIDEHVEVYNAALGYEVDYATGEFSAA